MLVFGLPNLTNAQMLLIPALPEVLITELQTTNNTANEEFIELYNTTNQDIDLADSTHQSKNAYKLQFFSSVKMAIPGFRWDPKTSGLTTIILSKTDNTPLVIAAHSYFLIATTGYKPGNVEPDFTYSSGHMSDAGGGLQLVSVSWLGTASTLVAYNPTGCRPLESRLCRAKRH